MHAPAAEFDDRRASRFLAGLLAILVIASLFVVWPFLTGTIFALVLGYLLRRPYRALVRVVRYRALAAAIIVIGVVVAVVGPLLFMSWRLVHDIRLVIASLDEGGGAQAWLVRTTASMGIDEATTLQLLDQAATGLAGAAQTSLLPTLGVIASIAANVGVFVFLLYFMLVEGEALGRFARDALPLPPERGEHLLVTTGSRVRALFLGTFLVAIIQGVVGAIGWWFFGFPAVVFWGFVMTILAVIPAIGPSLVMVPAGIYALAQGDIFTGVGIIVYGVVVVGLVDNFTRPFVVGRSSDVHPALVLLGTLGGLALFGTTGFILGPLLLSMVGPVLAEWEAIRRAPGSLT